MKRRRAFRCAERASHAASERRSGEALLRRDDLAARTAQRRERGRQPTASDEDGGVPEADARERDGCRPIGAAIEGVVQGFEPALDATGGRVQVRARVALIGEHPRGRVGEGVRAFEVLHPRRPGIRGGELGHGAVVLAAPPARVHQNVWA